MPGQQHNEHTKSRPFFVTSGSSYLLHSPIKTSVEPLYSIYHCLLAADVLCLQGMLEACSTVSVLESSSSWVQAAVWQTAV